MSQTLKNGDGQNYLGLSAASGIANTVFLTSSSPGLTVQQAFTIDTKIDDGLPQSGNILAGYLNQNAVSRRFAWAAGGIATGASSGSNGPTNTATTGSSTTCYDNGGGSGPQQYSMEISSGSNVNCALSFKMQAY